MEKVSSSQRLKELLKIKGISQTDLSIKLNIPKSSLSMYMSGKRMFRQNRLTEISLAYNVNEAWLMGFDVPMTKGLKKEDAEQDFIVIEKFSILNNRDKRIILSTMDSMIEEYKNN